MAPSGYVEVNPSAAAQDVPELTPGDAARRDAPPSAGWKVLRHAALAAVAFGAVAGLAFAVASWRALPQRDDLATHSFPSQTATKHEQKAASDISLSESEAPMKQFYMYRVQNDENYSPENQNMANIGGALWYLHNEIVWHHWLRAGTYATTPKTRIERWLVFTKATPKLFAKGMNFGVVNTYDLGQCTGPFKCENLQEYGPVVGCESWTKPAHGTVGNNFPHQQWVGKNIYPNAMWYSLPGRCSSQKFWNQTGHCARFEPSGACPPKTIPTGSHSCTYTYQKVGELRISEIENISSFDGLVNDGGREYDRATDKGKHLHFWDHINDPQACQQRIDAVQALFRKKFPRQPVLEDPVCDFDVHKFYPHFPKGEFRTTTTSTTRKRTTTTTTTVTTTTGIPVRKGSFLVIGDWGYDPYVHRNVAGPNCQKHVGEKMLQKMKELGDVKFIINVGDSFYPNGVRSKDDPQWDAKWRNMYDKQLRSVPWYTVYGNHDYQHDPCACSQEPNACAQVNYDINDVDQFYMPGVNWYKPHPELKLEVVAMDLNMFVGGWNGTRRMNELSFDDCKFTACQDACRANSKNRAMEAFDLFHNRSKRSEAKNMLVFSHYPTDYFRSAPDFLAGLRDNSKRNITYFGGHRHNTDQDSTISTAPNTNWLVGGGGGWSCDGNKQGFVVGEIAHDYKVTTYAVLSDYSKCCRGNPQQA